MFYAWDILIPANTPKLAPITQELELPFGVITQIHIKFPAGCHGLVGVRLLRWTFQLVPLSSGEWITGDNETVPTETHYELLEVPTFLTFKGCSPSTGYPHMITVRVEVNPEVSEVEQSMLSSLDKIVEVLAGE